MNNKKEVYLKGRINLKSISDEMRNGYGTIYLSLRNYLKYFGMVTCETKEEKKYISNKNEEVPKQLSHGGAIVKVVPWQSLNGQLKVDHLESRKDRIKRIVGKDYKNYL